MDLKFVSEKLIDHDDRLERIEDKIDGLLTRNEFLTKMDKVISTLDRLDQKDYFRSIDLTATKQISASSRLNSGLRTNFLFTKQYFV